MDPLVAQTVQFLKEIVGQEYQKRHYVLAVSGGRDSMVLLEVFAQLLNGTSLKVAHFNHALRGQAAELDELIVVEQARRWGVEVRVGRPAPNQPPPESEAAMREARLRFISEHVKDFWVSAHHYQDQLETFFMRLIRGTGLEGLSGMRPLQGNCLRPFLKMRPSVLQAFATRNKTPFRNDESNATHRYFRNRIRHQLIPPMQKLMTEFGSEDAFAKRFCALVEEIGGVSDEMKTKTESLFGRYATVSPFWIRIERRQYFLWDRAIRMRWLRMVYEKLSLKSGDRESLMDLENRINRGVKRFDSKNGMEVRQSCGAVYFISKAKPEWLQLKLQWENHNNFARCDALNIKLKWDERYFGEAECRFFRPGDHYGSKKLKDALLRYRIPAIERKILPLLAKRNSSKVLWFYPVYCGEIEIAQMGFPYFKQHT